MILFILVLFNIQNGLPEQEVRYKYLYWVEANGQLLVRQSRTVMLRYKSLQYLGPKLYNTSIINVISLTAFKKKLTKLKITEIIAKAVNELYHKIV